MADALSKEMGLEHPTQQHGASANDHVQVQSHYSVEKQPDNLYDQVTNASEKHRERPRISSDSHVLQRTASGVDVEQAEKDFAELSREFTAISRLTRTQSRASGVRVKDVERAISSSDEHSEDAFDLETTLRGAWEADNAAGIKSKYIGELTCGKDVIITDSVRRRHLG